jgi:hypothetical protein
VLGNRRLGEFVACGPLEIAHNYVTGSESDGWSILKSEA